MERERERDHEKPCWTCRTFCVDLQAPAQIGELERQISKAIWKSVHHCHTYEVSMLGHKARPLRHCRRDRHRITAVNIVATAIVIIIVVFVVFVIVVNSTTTIIVIFQCVSVFAFGLVFARSTKSKALD